MYSFKHKSWTFNSFSAATADVTATASAANKNIDIHIKMTVVSRETLWKHPLAHWHRK